MPHRLVLVVPLLVAGCSSTPEPVDLLAQPDSRVTVCIGTSAQHAAGEDVFLEIVSGDAVLTSASFPVPGEVVLGIPSSAEEPRLLVDGNELASSPRGGGWGVSQGDGCPPGPSS